ncbi:Dipeptidyl aminopeptidase [Entophlyctis sp. JEL0112]|nr:Dipeptidyl aminopeptidase [Entophlyctis sp. JEL0112]
MILDKDKTKAFGRFASPISTDAFAGAAIGLAMLVPDKVDGVLYHVENRPQEKGRGALVVGGKDDHPVFRDVSLRTSVHEYGGAPITAFKGSFVFTDATDKRIFWLKRESREACAITPQNSFTRYADFNINPKEGHGVAVQESHLDTGEVVNCLVAFRLDDNANVAEPTVIASGSDFYSAPRFSPSGDHLAWIEWNLPEMPWTKSVIRCASWNHDTGNVSNPFTIVSGNFSVSQPYWHPVSGEIYFSNDESGYQNLFRYNLNSGTTSSLLKSPFLGDFSAPDWVLGQRSFDFLPDGKVVAGHSTKNGIGAISIIDPITQEIKTILENQITPALCTVGSRVFIVAGTPTSPVALSEILGLNGESEVRLRHIKSTTKGLEGLDIGEWVSVAEPIEFPTDGGLTAFGYFYGPKNPNHEPPNATDLPPLIVNCHGGPTSAADCILNPRIQWWTSRGFAFFDVNYGGSTGFGREYRARLDGKWGLVDVADVCNGALYLAGLGKVDGKKMSVTGGSAGGFTTLAVLAFRPEVFACGASKYGISDLKSLSLLTHKFESKYLDIVLGTTGLPAETVEQIYYTRSPIHHAENIRAPLLVLQGTEDRVVPRDQAEKIVRAIEGRGRQVEYVEFAGEGHGWRQETTITRASELEREFYLRSLGI